MTLRLIFLVFTIFFSILFSEEKSQSFTVDKNKELLIDKANTQEEAENQIEEQVQAPEFQTAFIKMLVYLFLFIALSVITVWSLKRMGKSKLAFANSSKSIKILEKRMLSPKSALYLIELDGNKLLVSESHLDMKIKALD